MKAIITILSVIVLVGLVLSHGHHGNTAHQNGQQNSHSGKNSHHMSNDMCKYTDHKGEQFNLHLFDSIGQLQFYDQSNTKSTVYVQVCGALPLDTTSSWGCGANSSVCVVSSAMKGTSFGSVTNVQRADAVSTLNGKSASGIELMFGNGELCNNGIARKAVVTYLCNMDIQDTAYSYPRVTGTIDECTVSITVESPLACPVANYCRSIHDDETCKQQSPVCSWSFGRCRAAGGCFGSSVEINAGIISFIIVTSAGLCLICVCGVCVCACRRRCRKSCPRRSAAKKSTKGKKRSAPKPKPEASFDNLPVYQLVPGSTPINPYNMENIQGYYMMPHQDENNNL